MMVQESQLFVGLLHRAPDGTNFALYAYDLESGSTVTDIAQRMLDEFGPFYYPSSMTHADIAAQFYANVYGHAPDVAAQAFWTARLDAGGATPASVIVEMIDGLTHYTGSDAATLASQALFNNRVAVSMYYAEYGGNEQGAPIVLEHVSSDPASVDQAIADMRGHWNIPADSAQPEPAPGPAPEPVPAPAPAPAPAPEPGPIPSTPDPIIKSGLPEHAGELSMLYVAYFGRPADWSGMDYYTGQAHFDLWSFTRGFSASPESQALYGATFGQAQVNAIYQNLFNRDAEAAGVDYWTAEVNAGRLDAAGAALAILLGAQNDDKTAVQHKLAVAGTFIAHVNTESEVLGYSGDAAAAYARAFLHTVDASQASFDAAMAHLDTAVAEVRATGPLAPHDAPVVELVGVAQG